MRHPDNANAAPSGEPASAHDIAALLDLLLDYMNLRNDGCLARELGIPPFAVGKLRSGACPIDADMLIRMHEATGLAVGDLRAGMGDHRQRFHY